MIIEKLGKITRRIALFCVYDIFSKHTPIKLHFILMSLKHNAMLTYKTTGRLQTLLKEINISF